MRSRSVMRTIAIVAGSSTTLLAVGLAATAQPPDHATVCHRTGSEVHPWVTIHPSVNGAFHGHLNHPDDAIPPFTYQGQEYSLNWPSDDVRLENGECVARQPREEEPPEVQPGPPIEREPPFTG